MAMKNLNLSILLVVFFTIVSLSYCQRLVSCPRAIGRLKPCLREIHGASLGHPISQSCCAKVLDAADTCPIRYRHVWFLKALDACDYNNSSDDDLKDEPIPMPKPTPSSPPPPPEDDYVYVDPKKESPRCHNDRDVLGRCVPELNANLHQNKPINSTCCAAILDMPVACAKETWSDLFNRFLDDCKAHH